jgi:hypothetical protein
MAYGATNDLNTLDETRPIGSIEAVDILDDSDRETRRTFKNVILLKHTNLGDHQPSVIDTTHIKDNAISTVKVQDGAITAAKLDPTVLSGGNITVGTVDTAQLKDNAVTTAKIADASVTATKLAANSVIAASVATGAIIPSALSGAPSVGSILVGQLSGGFAAFPLSGAFSLDGAGVATLNFPVGIWNDTKTSGTAGGTLTTATWNVRDLNSEIFDPTDMGVLAGNTISIAKGTYFVIAISTAYKVGKNKLRLMDTTGSGTQLVLGLNAEASAAGSDNCNAFLLGAFTLAAAGALQIQHYAEATEASDGGGRAQSITSIGETFSAIMLIKLA